MTRRQETKSPVFRCAIYTRKSSEEGLEQSFNSLHAQREACEAYIKSQAHEGWICLGAAYDDGGFSGGNLERPALKRLLGDIALGKVDVVVVYKVDRLTRSLGDFAKIVEIFDNASASFVSITQSFNTTTSMGRLTLNMLLSFAQYEREVTGERIRDKIAASKAKGMWMGGNVPLGYDAGDHTLVVNAQEAEQVRHIFNRYLELGSAHRLRDELERQGVRSKQRTTKAGKTIGGVPMNLGALYHLLQNRHYVGEIQHKDQTFPGRHPAIVDRETFDAVQRQLETRRVRRREQRDPIAKARLTGRIVGADGGPMTPSFSYGCGGKLHRYYVAAGVIAGRGGDVDGPKRIPADALEAFILEQMQRVSGRSAAGWEALDPALERLEVGVSEAHLVLDAKALFGAAPRQLALSDAQARLAQGQRLIVEAEAPEKLRLIIPIRLVFRGGRTWLSDAHGGSLRRVGRQDRALASALKTAHAIHRRHGVNVNITRDWAIADAPANPHDRKMCELAFLAPDLQRKILEGRQPAALNLGRLLEAEIPLSWTEQRAWFEAMR